MSVGTSLVVGKKALIACLNENTALTASGVNISYQAPLLPADLKADDGDYEAIWLGGATIVNEVPILTAGHLHRDEIIRLEVFVQVLKPGSAGTQEAADTRAAELLAELERVLANNVDLGVTDPSRFEALFVGSHRHIPGFLGNGQGHGSRFDCSVEFTARLTPT